MVVEVILAGWCGIAYHCYCLPQGHKREGSFGGVRGFLPPAASLESSLGITGARGYVPARPMNVQGRKGKAEGAEVQEGSSTESQSHMHELSAVPEVQGTPQQYTHTVVDSQYVLIEATPPSEVAVEVRCAVYKWVWSTLTGPSLHRYKCPDSPGTRSQQRRLDKTAGRPARQR